MGFQRVVAQRSTNSPAKLDSPIREGRPHCSAMAEPVQFIGSACAAVTCLEEVLGSRRDIAELDSAAYERQLPG